MHKFPPQQEQQLRIGLEQRERLLRESAANESLITIAAQRAALELGLTAVEVDILDIRFEVDGIYFVPKAPPEKLNGHDAEASIPR